MPKPNKYSDGVPAVKPRRKHIRKPGDLGTLKKKMWLAVVSAQDILTSDHVSTDQRLRAVHALVQAGGAYLKLLETSDLQEQLDHLKTEMANLKAQMPLRKVG